MSTKDDYDALLIDTSIFDANGLRLEKGLLGKLHQFKKSPVDFLMPDVIIGEVKTHLEQKIRASKSSLEKAINEAGDHLFINGNTYDDAKKLLEGNETDGLADTRLQNFLEVTGAVKIECGDYLSVSSLLERYFSNKAPFAETGKKKNEFPDAIVLMAIEVWAEKNNKSVLAVARDDDWSKYCENSQHIDCITELSDALAAFNRATAPYAFLSRLETALEEGNAQSFIDGIATNLALLLDGITPDQDAESYLYWEAEGSNGWYEDFHLTSNEFRIIDSDEDYIVLEGKAEITVGAEGDFSLSVHDSIDDDYVRIGHVTAKTEKEFTSKILITITGALDGPLDDLEIEEVEIVTPIKRIHFGTIEADLSEYE